MAFAFDGVAVYASIMWDAEKGEPLRKRRRSCRSRASCRSGNEYLHVSIVRCEGKTVKVTVLPTPSPLSGGKA
jgi:hypothetical protein